MYRSAPPYAFGFIKMRLELVRQSDVLAADPGRAALLRRVRVERRFSAAYMDI